MLRNTIAVSLLLAILAGSMACTKKVSYAKDIKPVLAEYCTECHIRGKNGYAESGLSMETYADLMKGTKFGPVIEPGHSVSSTLIRLVEHRADPSINMPHKKAKIKEAHIKLLKLWIDQGAKDN